MKNIRDITSWIVTEGMAGTENQCLGVAENMGFQPTIIRTGLRQPWSLLSPWLGFECESSFTTPLLPPWPDLLITSGRKAVAAARYIKKKSGGRTFCAHIQDPRCQARFFDLVAVPFHDPTRGENVLVTDVAPNRITSEKLANARRHFKEFEKLTAPRVAVLIGGKSRAYKMSANDVTRLIQQLFELQKTHGASLLITVSRRTGEENVEQIRQAFAGHANVSFWDGSGENPYMGYLAYADYILVSADSVSMISDALSTGKSTYVIPLEGGKKRLELFHRHIRMKGFVRTFEGNLEAYSYAPVNEAARIADLICNKMNIYRE